MALSDPLNSKIVQAQQCTIINRNGKSCVWERGNVLSGGDEEVHHLYSVSYCSHSAISQKKTTETQKRTVRTQIMQEGRFDLHIK